MLMFDNIFSQGIDSTKDNSKSFHQYLIKNNLTKNDFGESLNIELQNEAIQRINEYCKEKGIESIEIGELYKQNNSEELRTMCGTKDDIMYSILHRFNIDNELIEEYIQFDDKMNILGVIKAEDLQSYVTKRVNNSIDFEKLFEEK